MQIIFGQDIAEEVRMRHIVLELETFTVKDSEKTAYCVVRPESIMLTEMPDIQRLCKLHEETIEALKRNDVNTVLEGIGNLRGHFGGELDSFYDVIRKRITENK
jgi:hypothetical protein